MFVPLAPAAKKNRRGPPALLPGAGVWRHAWGDGDAGGAAGGKARSTEALSHHEGFEFFRKISNFCGLGYSRKAVARGPVTTSHQNTQVYVQRSCGFCRIPPCSVAPFEVNSEPHTGARPSVRFCVGLIIQRCTRGRFVSTPAM
jgi:hypothetical protein